MEQISSVRRKGWAGISQRAASFALIIALLPTLTFLGHWTLHIDVPGTNLYLVLVPAEPESAHTHTDTAEHEDGGSHSQHCHTSAASCSDIPFTGASPFALINDSLAHLGEAGALIAIALALWRPWRSLQIAPELLPPRLNPAL